MKKPEIVSANKQTWHVIIFDTLWKVQSLLNATRTLLQDVKEADEEGGWVVTEGDPSVPAGLYTFAVEEYGKYLYLKSITPVDQKYIIKYTEEFTNHTKKFERALSYLPDECRRLHLGEKDDMPYYEPDIHDDIVADFETRLRIFYSDFDPHFANKVTKRSPPVSVKLLQIATEKLWEISESQLTEHIKNKDNS